jgi:hypothetical protein
MVDQCLGAGKRLIQWSAMLVAEGHDKDFDTPKPWFTACAERWGWAPANCCHMLAVGRLLLRPTSGIVTVTMSGLDFQKLLAISRLPPNLLESFIIRSKPQDRSRDEVRAAVNRWLKAAGEPVDDQAVAPPAAADTRRAQHQSDFLDALFSAPPGNLTDIHVWQVRVHERAAKEITDSWAAGDVFMRSLCVCEAMVERMHGQQLLDVATNLRMIAEDAEKQAATQKTLTP